jgi:hypothetical protein
MQRLKQFCLSVPALTLAAFVAATMPAVAHADIVTYADSTNPLAFFPLQTSGQGSSANNVYTTTYQNGAADVSSNGGPQSSAVSLNGDNTNPQYVSTSLLGGINGAGSISAYINVAAIGGADQYIAGESQYGNDFDFQLQAATSTTENLCFYTASGSSTCATVLDSSLLDTWNMVTATYDSTMTGNNQDVYVNGVLVATNTAGSGGAKTFQFNIGYSTVFGGRDFDGLISDVGVWNYQLSGTQVAALDNPPNVGPPSATPEPSSLILLGTGALAGLGTLRRRLATR